MDVLHLGPLRVRRIVKTHGTPPKSPSDAPLTVVLMHGYGAPGDDLVSLEAAIDAVVGTTFLFPEAPSTLGQGLGFESARAWWDIDIARFQNAMMRGTFNDLVDQVPPGMSAATADVLAMLDALERDTKTTSDTIVLGGFSQGSMLALDVALRSTRPFGGLALLSSTLLAKQEWLPLMPARKGMKVFQSHGRDDRILPYVVASELHRELLAGGLAVTFTPFEGAHGISPLVVRALSEWLAGVASKRS